MSKRKDYCPLKVSARMCLLWGRWEHKSAPRNPLNLQRKTSQWSKTEGPGKIETRSGER